MVKAILVGESEITSDNIKNLTKNLSEYIEKYYSSIYSVLNASNNKQLASCSDIKDIGEYFIYTCGNSIHCLIDIV